MKLNFEQVVSVLEAADTIICVYHMGNEVLIDYKGRQEEGDEESPYVVSPAGCDDIVIRRPCKPGDAVAELHVNNTGVLSFTGRHFDLMLYETMDGYDALKRAGLL